VKSSRFITHVKKLAHPEKYVALFLERTSGLGEKLHVMLFQLPPSWIFDRGRLEGLCDLLSRQKIAPGIRLALDVWHGLVVLRCRAGCLEAILCLLGRS
jgi:uncharacterized protein YecE (DUF72 family)